MHPAPSLAEAPPKTDESRPGYNSPVSPETHVSHGDRGRGSPSSPPVRKDTTSSTSTTLTSATVVTGASSDTVSTAYGHLDSPPSFATQAIFPVKDGADPASNRRASRRRTGPLSAVQRERAALIRKLGACTDCRRRRVACHPNHHNMTWEDAARKYRSHSPNIHDLSPVSRRPLSPAMINSKSAYLEPQEMDLDTPPAQHPGRPPLSETRIRTPLPSGPRLDKPASMTLLPSIDNLKSDLQSAATRILADPYGSRYTSVQALLLHWEDDDDPSVRHAVDGLATVFESSYNYAFRIRAIPSSSSCKSPWRWLSREITEFVDTHDQRDVLKIIYYNGRSYLDADREMVLASTQSPESAYPIRWSGIQQILEDACSDTLILMDAAYYPSSTLVRRQGVLELIAASASEDHARLIDRGVFTRALIDLLHIRASQKFTHPLSAAELHAKLLSLYPKMIQDRQPEKEMLTSFPSPLHVQISGDSRLPSVLLAPIRTGIMPSTLDAVLNGPQLSLSFKLTEDSFDADSWLVWLRSMPQGIRDVRFEGPYRNNVLR